MFKEAGYDEFLNAKIEQAERAVKQGKLIKPTQANEKMQILFKTLEKEQQEREREFAFEVSYA